MEYHEALSLVKLGTESVILFY